MTMRSISEVPHFADVINMEQNIEPDSGPTIIANSHGPLENTPDDFEDYRITVEEACFWVDLVNGQRTWENPFHNDDLAFSTAYRNSLDLWTPSDWRCRLFWVAKLDAAMSKIDAEDNLADSVRAISAYYVSTVERLVQRVTAHRDEIAVTISSKNLPLAGDSWNEAVHLRTQCISELRDLNAVHDMLLPNEIGAVDCTIFALLAEHLQACSNVLSQAQAGEPKARELGFTDEIDAWKKNKPVIMNAVATLEAANIGGQEMASDLIAETEALIEELEAHIAEGMRRSSDELIGMQLRSFRLQRGKTLKSVATYYALSMSDDEDSGSIESATNIISRLERGVRHARPEQLRVIGDILNFTQRELAAPLGYQLWGAEKHVAIDLRGETPEIKAIQPLIDVTSDAFSKTMLGELTELADGPVRRAGTQATMPYIPPIIDADITDVEDVLDDDDVLDLCRAIVEIHYPALQTAVNYRNDESDDPVTEHRFPLEDRTNTEITIEATRLVEQLDWNVVVADQHPVVVTASLYCSDTAEYDAMGIMFDQQWFRSGLEREEPEQPPSAPVIPDEVGRSAHPAPLSAPANVPKIPVLGFAQGGYDMEFVDNGDAFEHIDTPPFLAEIPQSFAVIVANDSMEPRYEPGDYLYCHPNKQPRRGDYVVVAMTGQRAVVKRFIRRTPESVILEQLNPAEEITVPVDEMQSIFVVVGTKTL